MPDAPGLAGGDRLASADTSSADADGELLVELPVAVTLDDIARGRRAPFDGSRDVGGFFQPIRFLAERVA